MQRWGLVFLACPVTFSDEERERLVRTAARAWFEDEDRVAFNWPEMRGEVVASSEAQVLGSFCGQRFSAEVFRPGGGEGQKVEFLVTEAVLRQNAGPVAEA